MLGEGGPVFFLMPENKCKMTFITVKVVSSSVHKILEDWSYRCADCLLRLHTCMFQPWNDVLCVLSRYRKVSKYWESGSLIGWWSHPLSHRILKRYSVYWASREQSAAAAVWLYGVRAGRCCVSVSCNWQDPDLIDNIIILHTQPGPGTLPRAHNTVPWPQRIEAFWVLIYL